MFEVENERRQLGLPSRVRFIDHSSDQFTASTTLRGQNSWECVTTKLVLQVRESILFLFHLDPLKSKECSFFFTSSWKEPLYLTSYII